MILLIKRLFCHHKYPKGCGYLKFIGTNLDGPGSRLYFYQNYCYKCGKKYRIIGNDSDIALWREVYEKET